MEARNEWKLRRGAARLAGCCSCGCGICWRLSHISSDLGRSVGRRAKLVAIQTLAGEPDTVGLVLSLDTTRALSSVSGGGGSISGCESEPLFEKRELAERQLTSGGAARKFAIAPHDPASEAALAGSARLG